MSIALIPKNPPICPPSPIFCFPKIFVSLKKHSGKVATAEKHNRPRHALNPSRSTHCVAGSTDVVRAEGLEAVVWGVVRASGTPSSRPLTSARAADGPSAVAGG